MLVGIDKDNMIQKYEEGQELIAGDVLFVYYDTDNHLSAKGMPHVRVSLAYEDLWNDAGWLRSIYGTGDLPEIISSAMVFLW